MEHLPPLSPLHAITAMMKAKGCAAKAIDMLEAGHEDLVSETATAAMFLRLHNAYSELIEATSYMRQIMATLDPDMSLISVVAKNAQAVVRGTPDLKAAAVKKLLAVMGRVEP